MTQADEKHLTLVCYRSGYGGDFLCALLDEALGNLKFDVRDANNRYWGKNYVFSSVNEQIKSLHHIFSYYYNKDSVQVIDRLCGKADWADDIKMIYNICYDDNEELFIDNIVQYIASDLRLPYTHNVANIHYMGEFPAFDISKIFHPMSIISLKTESELYFQYFHSFSQIKTNFDVLKRAMTMKKEVFDCEPIPNSKIIDVGKLFFEDSLDDTISNTLSEIIGREIKINIGELKRYREDNAKVLVRYFGNDYASLDASSFRQRKLELFKRVAEGEDN